MFDLLEAPSPLRDVVSSVIIGSGTPVSSTARGRMVHTSAFEVVSTSLKLHPVMVAQVSVTDVAVVLVEPPVTVVANILFVKHRAASAGSQLVGFGAGSILPPGWTLFIFVSTCLQQPRNRGRSIRHSIRP